MFSEFPVLHTNRLLLRQITDADLPRVFEGLSRPEMIQFYGVSYNTPEETQIQMEWYRKLREEQTGTWWGITLAHQTESLIGAIGINNLNATHRNAEAGFWILPEFQQKGYMREAFSAVLQYLFTHTNLHRVYALVEPENGPSLSLLEKSGFVREGIQREVEWKNGRFIDLIWFGLLEQEYRTLKR